MQQIRHHLPMQFMLRIKDYGLPISILSGIILYRPLSLLKGVVPYMIVLMLFFTFLKLSPKEIKVTKVHWQLLLLQMGLSLAAYFSIRYLPIPYAEVLAQGFMMCFLCPVASASPVVVGILNGSVGIATSYVLLGSLSTAISSPIILGWLGNAHEPFIVSFLKILGGIAPLVVLPLILAQSVRKYTPKLHSRLNLIPSAAFWIWFFALALIIANTVKYMVQEPVSMIPTMVYLGVFGLIACVIQFSIGKILSKKILGESVTLGQSLAQKNSTLGIWLIHTYLNPLASVGMATYSIWQNLFNTFQLLLHHKKGRKRLTEDNGYTG